MHRTWIEIKEQALVSNVQILKAFLSEGSRFCAVVKVNAYGHGLKDVARILRRQGIDVFATDTIEDALTLRELFPDVQIIVLGYVMEDKFKIAIDEHIDLTLYDTESIEAFEAAASKCLQKGRFHLKIETGLYRQGLLFEDVPDVLRRIVQCAHLELVGISTHFANIEETTRPEFATRQFQTLLQGESYVSEMGFENVSVHAACSAALLLYPDTHRDLVRVGISLYGIWPSVLVEEMLRKQSISCDLEPVLTWKTRIAQIKSVPGGTAIGYGLSETLSKRSRIAILPVGYSDGYDRHLSSVGEVLVNGYKCKVVGRVCMNMMMIDVSEVPRAIKGQEVILLGKDARHFITAESMAKKTHTIAYEIISRIHPLIPRIIV